MVAFSDTVFNTYGHIPTDSNFWDQATDRFVSSDGLTPKFSRVVAEQMFMPIQTPKLPWYTRFAGRPLDRGAGWTERMVEETGPTHLNPKATAQDALGFVDSTGIEKTYEIDYSARKTVSLPTELYSVEEFVDSNGPYQLNNILLQLNEMGYQRSADSAIAKKVVSCSTGKVELETGYDMTDLYKIIRDTATDMMCRGVTGFNELTADENKNIDISAERVLAFMPVKLWNELRSSRASLPSPNELVDNVEVVPIYDTALPTPLTTAEFTAGNKVSDTETITWDNKPKNIDGKTPIVFLMDPRKVEFRPVRQSYKINLNQNGAGDFTNSHLVARAAVGVRPWFNACSIVESAGA